MPRRDRLRARAPRRVDAARAGRGADRRSSRAGPQIDREPLGVVLIIGPWNYPRPARARAARRRDRRRQRGGAQAVGARAARRRARSPRLVPEYLDPECVAVVEGGVAETDRAARRALGPHLLHGQRHRRPVVMAAAAEAPHARSRSSSAARARPSSTATPTSTSPRSASRGASSSTPARRASRPTTCSSTATVERPLARRAARRPCATFYGDDPRAEPRLRAHRQRPPLRPAGRAARRRAARPSSAARPTPPTATSRRPSLTGVDPDAPIMAEEIFGPLLPVLPVDDVDDGDRLRQRRATSRSRCTCSREDRRRRDRVVASTQRPAASCVNAHAAATSRSRASRSAASARAAWARTTAVPASTRSATARACSTARRASTRRWPTRRTAGWKQKLIRRLL